VDERLGLEPVIATHLSDCRPGLNTQFLVADLPRPSVPVPSKPATAAAEGANHGVL